MKIVLRLEKYVSALLLKMSRYVEKTPPEPITTGLSWSAPIEEYDPTRPSYAQPFRQRITRSVKSVQTVPPVPPVPVIQEHEPALLDRAYPDVFPEKLVPLQPPQTNLIINPVPIYISLDSRDRDRAMWPETNQYRVPFVTSSTNRNIKTTGDRIKNIYSISLLSCVVPNTDEVFDQPYLLLQVDEIEGIYDAANPTTSNALTKLYFRECYSGSKFLRLDKGVGDPTARIYWPAPKASLEQLTVSFRNYDGTLFSFGTDTTPPTEPNTELQTTLTLEIKTYIVDTLDTIGHRNPN
jgi:hypothetical protein